MFALDDARPRIFLVPLPRGAIVGGSLAEGCRDGTFVAPASIVGDSLGDSLAGNTPVR